MKIKYFEEASGQPADIKVVGIGGGGGNALNRMATAGLKGVELVAINSDAQALRKSKANVRVQIGEGAKKGLGAGGNPSVGKKAADENREEIKSELLGVDMVFVTAGMGGGTGTGAAPVVAEIARSLGALTVGVVTYPFGLEGKVRQQQATVGIEELKQYVDTLLVIPNDKLFELGSKDMSWEEAFKLADDVLRQAIQAITDVITVTGVINVDFADVKAIMTGAGGAIMGIGEATGEDRAKTAMRAAFNSPLLTDVSIKGAKGVLINITGGRDFRMSELNEIMMIVDEFKSDEAHVYYGQVIDDKMQGKVKVTLIATGFSSEQKSPVPRAAQPKKEETKKKKISMVGQLDADTDVEDVNRPAYLRKTPSKLI